ncbi:hypothetical protein [Micromonospora sp. WMMD1082]|uniref:hypothetical protein n=1 Tax=Micromonospora sp. WMMD1082 TaxID=3016104 RepID=UPI00241743D9|nr:hypothetical protein [Micromonospora sp. WMMD1082]MDG4796427.1 hypothetical protein [Micromonospora sp. WMMD1082]
MFGNDPDLLLTLHRTHAAELRAEAARERLARSVPHRSARGWLRRRHHPDRSTR